MIDRIPVIKQVGRFHDFKNGGSVHFSGGKNTTLVHGRNTYGKTTFTQILKSLGENNPSLISSRTSIPPSGSQQEVKLNYIDKSGTTRTADFKSGVWSSNDLVGRIVVFDQDFIHTHVMLGDLITRENKEHFTDFILGEEGVRLSKKIEGDKKTLRQLKANLSTFRPSFVRALSSEPEVQKFVDMKVDKDTPALELDLETETKHLLRLERISDFKKVAVPDASKDSAELSIKALTTEHGVILNESYDSISDEAWKTLQEHISNSNLDESAIAWLKSGTKINKHSDTCPFCSQDLSGVKSLIEAYQNIFDAKFEAYDSTLRTRVTKLDSNLSLETAKSFTQPVYSFIESLKLFQPYIQEVADDINDIQDQITLLEAADTTYKQHLAAWTQNTSKEREAKLTNTHKAFASGVPTTELFQSAKAVAKIQDDVYDAQLKALKHIKTAKTAIDKLTSEQITSGKETQNKRINAIKQMIARIEQDEQCGIYTSKKKDISNLNVQISDDSEKLEDEQSEYLEEYFKELGEWFKKLGSDSGFEINKASTNKGDKKVYSLSITYHGEKVASEDLGKVCSESDKRNLALAIFLSKAENLPDKDKYVLVFDDPVVSFDDNRISATCREIKLIAPKFSQIIVTTHYASLVKNFVETKIDSSYISIELDSNKSVLKELHQPDKFVSNAHIKAAENLIQFVEGATNDLAIRDLRPFMEEHLRIRFQKQIAFLQELEPGFANLINALQENSVIGSVSQAKLHAFREDLNPDMHRSGEEPNTEQIRNDTRQLLELLYSDMSQ